MIPELGQFALVFAFVVCIVQCLLPLVGAARGRGRWIAVASPAAQLQLMLHIVALACLIHAFVNGDFSVLYVARNSSPSLPLEYRISALWGAHEGSLLLWSTILSSWSVAVGVLSRSMPLSFKGRVIGTMGFVSSGFLAFMLFTSNPFERVLPPTGQVADLNPLLQDFGLIVHPPMLYMGYVGLAVPFSFAVAALLEGRIDSAWTRWTRPWTNAAWVFLTLGITLGSWWAYYELGWGGWWFWDPVENASFMPWLIATALVHSMAVSEKRGAFKAWTLLLAILGFSLSLLGTFMVRSGVLVSVHAFATDPERGVFILIFLLTVIASALALYAWHASRIGGDGCFHFISREALLLINNVLLVGAMGTVLLGTLYPLLMDAFGIGKISVGPPYFSAVLVPLMLPLAFLMGLGPLTRWGEDAVRALVVRYWRTILVSAVLGGVFVVISFKPVSVGAVLGMSTAVWVIFAVSHSVTSRMSPGRRRFAAIRRLPRAFLGMNLAHLGVAVFIVGVTASGTWGLEQDAALRTGDSFEVAGYRVRLDGVTVHQGPNYEATRATLSLGAIVDKDLANGIALYPERRWYRGSRRSMTEAGISAGVLRDFYVALGEPLGGDSWAVRAYYKPFQRWIWFGALLMALGGALAASDRRYRTASRAAAGLEFPEGRLAG